MTAASLEYIAAGGNRHPSSADWAPSLLAFGAGNNIALWNPDDEDSHGITALLSGHGDSVNVVRIWEKQSKRFIASGSADKTIRIWSDSDKTISGFEEIQCLTDHAASVNALAVLPSEGLFVSGAADGTVKIWHFSEVGVQPVQSIALQPRYIPLALALVALPGGDIVLAVAGTSNLIQLYAQYPSAGGFELQATLSGHEGWIRSLDFTRERNTPESDILLASASQDKYIRLWRFHNGSTAVPTHTSAAYDLSKKVSLSNKAHEVGSESRKHTVTFEALLIGHEDWIYTARWAPGGGDDHEHAPALLSASADNSLSIWTAEPASGLWVCSSRLGEISSQKGSTTATGSTGGFWIGLWQPEGRSIVSLGRTGSWRKWTRDESHDMWIQQVATSGHVEEVRSIAWAPSGGYLVSTGSDQTTRLLAQWCRGEKLSWHEFSRPQIHGYDLNCLDLITDNQFISGADEKLLRVFNKPKAVDELLHRLGGIESSATDDLPDAANIPVLGLSNKAVTAVDDEDPLNGVPNEDDEGREAVDPGSTLRKSTLELDQPPFEDHLARHTLWPEHEKLYGHGYEISAVATSNDHSVVATACKASSLDHAVIRLYDTTDWREVKPPLSAHSLTVTALAFSPDDQYLLSVGRDRQWALFQRSADAATHYAAHTSHPKGHSRMILDCSWAPLTGGHHVFATAGRDKSVQVWKVDGGAAESVATVSAPASVTAVAFHQHPCRADTFLLAYGTEEGGIGLVSLRSGSYQVEEQQSLDPAIVPSKTVNALRWRPRGPGRESGARVLQLAAASDDCSVRIYNVS
jgi:elongator complex protein 2